MTTHMLAVLNPSGYNTRELSFDKGNCVIIYSLYNVYLFEIIIVKY
jgi:hypothetical protein